MRKILSLLGILALSTTASASVVACGSNWKKEVVNTEQNTIYIDKNGKQVITSEKDLSTIDSEEVVQIGFYKNINKQIQVVRMPKTIKKVPDQLPVEITNMSNMFINAIWFNQDLSSWNVSNVTDMNGMFINAYSFNQDLSSWNVKNVTNMAEMFYNARSFNQNLSSWKVDNVTNMQEMFAGALAFNQNLSSWNVKNVTNMQEMFAGALAFNQNLSSWKVDNVKKHDNFSINSGINDANKLPKFK